MISDFFSYTKAIFRFYFYDNESVRCKVRKVLRERVVITKGRLCEAGCTMENILSLTYVFVCSFTTRLMLIYTIQLKESELHLAIVFSSFCVQLVNQSMCAGEVSSREHWLVAASPGRRDCNVHFTLRPQVLFNYPRQPIMISLHTCHTTSRHHPPIQSAVCPQTHLRTPVLHSYTPDRLCS